MVQDLVRFMHKEHRCMPLQLSPLLAHLLIILLGKVAAFEIGLDVGFACPLLFSVRGSGRESIAGRLTSTNAYDTDS